MDMILHDAPDMSDPDSVLRPRIHICSRESLRCISNLAGRAGWGLTKRTSFAGPGGVGSGWRLFPYVPRPAYRYVPSGFVLTNPATSDSSDWFAIPPTPAGTPAILRGLERRVRDAGRSTSAASVHRAILASICHVANATRAPESDVQARRHCACCDGV